MRKQALVVWAGIQGQSDTMVDSMYQSIGTAGWELGRGLVRLVNLQAQRAWQRQEHRQIGNGCGGIFPVQSIFLEELA